MLRKRFHGRHFPSKDFQKRLQKRNDHWTNQDSNRPQCGHAAQNAKQRQQWMEVGLSVKDYGFDQIVGHRNDGGAINRQPNRCRQVVVKKVELETARNPNGGRANERNHCKNG